MTGFISGYLTVVVVCYVGVRECVTKCVCERVCVVL